MWAWPDASITYQNIECVFYTGILGDFVLMWNSLNTWFKIYPVCNM